MPGAARPPRVGGAALLRQIGIRGDLRRGPGVVRPDGRTPPPPEAGPTCRIGTGNVAYIVETGCAGMGDGSDDHEVWV